MNKILPMSSVDGPGNRCAIFFQGCNLCCAYCHNPETIHLCAGCGLCVQQCPTGALTAGEGQIHWRQELCCGCDVCIRSCRRSASPKVRWMTPEEVMAEVSKSLPFIRGITVSGGECSLQRGFLLELFALSRQAGLTALMDSNGLYDYGEDPALMALCDGVMLDIKCWDDPAHQRLTGCGNHRILRAARFLAGEGKLPEVRTVVVPDLLPNRQTVEQVSRLLAPYQAAGAIRYKLIAFRPLGVRGALADCPPPDPALLEDLEALARSNGMADVVIV